jgi:hypothetical protein
MILYTIFRAGRERNRVWLGRIPGITGEILIFPVLKSEIKSKITIAPEADDPIARS